MLKQLMLLGIIQICKSRIDASEVNNKFSEEGIFPDVLEEVTFDINLLNIVYPISRVQVSLGNKLTPSQVSQQPYIKYDADADEFYTLLMTDPDVPSRQNPTRREYRHWLMMNVNGDDLNSGNVIFEYRGSGPPAGSGLHRYIFLIFKQASNNLEYEMNNETLERANTNTRNLISEFNLTLVAGNFFQAEFEGVPGFVNDRFRDAEIVPDILDELTVELKSLNVTYPTSGVSVDFGNVLRPSQVRDEPEVEWDVEDGAFYTLLLTDPDAPSRDNPTRREYRHWLTMNVNGDDLTSGDVIFEYRGSGPPAGSGLHRYIFLIFKQASNNLEYEMNNETLERANTNTRNLISEFNLTLVAGNFFQAEFEGVPGFVNDRFRDAEIVPDILDELTVELKSLNVTYPTSGVSVDFGNVLRPSQVRDEPEVEWDVEDGAFYTLLLTDPDAPSRDNPTRREYRHWLTMNVNGDDLTSGDVIFEYRGSGPPAGSGLHRYIFLIFKQASNNLEYEMNNETLERANTNTRNLISEFNLTLVAGNFFQAEFEGVPGFVNDRFRDAEIVPDILDELTVELKSLNVTYPTSGVSVDFGNVLRPSQVRDEPEVEWDVEDGAFYTLLLTDPDAPSRDNPTRREYRHWLTMNVNGDDLTSGDVIFEYRGSGPPAGSGLHRYIFLIFKQASNNLEYEMNNETLERANTNTRNLISEFNLTLVAGNFFQAEFEGVPGFVNDRFRDAEIVPDILDELTVELKSLNVTYPTSGVSVDFGNVLRPSQVRDEPEVEWDVEDGAFYTLLLTDPDAPSRDNPTRREYRHWLTMNVNGDDLTSGDVIFEYRGSGPPAGSGLHRYIFLIFKQASNNLEYEMNNETLERANTNTRNLISEFNLTLVAGNFFQAEFEGVPGFVNDRFRDAEIVPDILDELTVELKSLNVTYPTSGVSVDFGNVLRPSQVRDEPEVEWDVEDGAFYTLLLTDPDAPSRDNPTRREYRHWLTMNVNGDDLTSGDVIFEYRGSGPPAGSGLHRYIFLIFKQASNNLEYEMNNETLERANTNTRNLISEFNLTLVAGNFFQAEFEGVPGFVNDRFRDAEIVPDILDELTVELKSLNVTYPTSGVSVDFGNVLRPSQVRDEPEVEWDVEDGAFYTLLLTDPDAPSRDNPTRREYRHWLTMNVNGDDLTSGDVIFEYRGSGPPAGSGLHRYIFLIFKQASNNLEYEMNNETLERANTNTRNLISEFNLTLVAGNFFQAEFEGVPGFVNDRFRDAEIVPDILDELTVELKSLNVTYPTSGVSVDFGNVLRPSQVRDEPEVEWDVEDGAFYTLLLTDPDAPSRDNPTRREYRHWLTMNVNGDDLTSGDVIFEYRGSGPPAGSGLHRYIFLIFKQASNNLEYEMNNETLERANTNTRNLISEFNLTLVAGNFFQAEFEGVPGFVNDRFRDAEIVPDILDELTVELKSLNVTYPTSGVSVDFGNVLRPSQVRDEPEVEWDVEDGAFYTLLLTDPDAPSRDNPTRREYRHWLTMNVNGDDLTSGDVIFEYRGSGPPAGSGLHRYIFLIFKQASNNLEYEMNNETLERANTNTRNLISEFNLTLVAGNFFQAEFEGVPGFVNDRFRDAEIVPDILDELTVELKSLNVTYPSSGISVDFGNVLRPSQVRDEPEVEWDVEDGAFYTLLLTDPDAPSRDNPTRREYRHWLTMNVNGDDLTSGNVIFEYRGSGPPAGSGLHRYIFLIFKQASNNLEYEMNNETLERANTNTRNLISEFNLTLVAGNFFQAEFEGVPGFVNDRFRDAEIVPDILDELTVELKSLNVTYPTSGVSVDFGNVLRPSQVRDEPEVEWDVEDGAFYTLLLTDPDAPSRDNPTRREYRHWLTMNVNGDDLTSGDVIFEYRGSGPPAGSGLHRYIFLIFKQASNNLEYEMNNETLERANTNTRNLISEFNLTLVAGNFFQAEFEGVPGFVNDRFRDAEIVPDILDELTVELKSLNVTYPSSEVSVDFGNVLRPSQVRDEPEVEWDVEDGAFYTLLLTDPDAPSRDNPTRREYRHWLTMNVNGDDLTSGDVIFEYRGSGPPAGSGLHRYIFLIFKQASNNLEYEMNNETLERANTNTRNLISEFNLTLVAGNFFQAEFEGVPGFVNDRFRDAEIVPDILDELTVELKSLNVTYPTSGVSVDFGNVLRPSQVRDEPEVEWDVEDGAFYTLLLTDPDAPSRDNPTRREYRHWLTMNVNGDDLTSGDVIFEYRGSGPPAGSGLHRYIFLIFKQASNNLEYEMNNETLERANTNTRNLISEFNLTLVAGNFFQAEFEGVPGFVNDRFRNAEIVPDILDELTVELKSLNVTYPSSGVSVDFGNVLRPSQVRDEPEVEWDVEDGAFYTLLLTDPDAPSRDNPTRREYRHWLTMNVNGDDLTSGDVIFEYRGSGPPSGSGLHRYIFLIFKQASNNLEYEMNNETLERANTNTRNLISEFNLTLVAGNFFQAEFEGVPGFVNDRFRDAEIVPDILDELTVGLKSLNVTYPTSGVSVDFGNVLRPSQVRDEPEVEWDVEDGAFYTLLLTDPDAPSRDNPTRREYRHWLTMNANGDDLTSGDVIFEYRGSGPPAGSGLHRYIFLIFKQASNNLEYEMNNETLERANTNTRNLISEFNLTLVAGNFFQAQFEGVSGFVNDKFRDAEIVPDILDELTVELKPLNVTYPSSGVSVELGNELRVSQVRNQPEVNWNTDFGAFYTLLMTDSDAPSREDPARREIRHWLTMNIDGDDLASGDVIFEYRGSGPSFGTGLHRYIFLLFKQSTNDLKYLNETSDRANTNTRNFISEFNLTLIAGNFFEAQFEGVTGFINDKFRESQIVPDILDEFTIELKPLNVTYPSSGANVDLGNVLKPSQVTGQPEVRWEAEADAFYTLLMTDPDAFAQENAMAIEYRHWLAMNINSSDFNSGDVIFEYRVSVPPEGTGLHRYVFLLFKQAKNNIEYEINGMTLERVNTNTRNLIKELDLTLVAGDFFQAEYEGAAGIILVNYYLLVTLIVAQVYVVVQMA